MKKLLALLLGAFMASAQITTLPNSGAAGAGDITGVTAGDGLTGGGASGGVTVTNGAALYGCTDTGGDDTYVCAPSGFPAAYATGLTLRVVFTTSNTGAATIDAGPGAKAIKLPGGSTDPTTGDIVALKPMLVTYDAAANSAAGGWILAVGGAGVGNVVGPASATDNCAAIYDGTTGKLLKDSTLCQDLTKNATTIFGGFTSGTLAFSVANVAGTATTLIWPTDTSTATTGYTLSLGAVATCPTLLPASAPSTCRFLTWASAGAGGPPSDRDVYASVFTCNSTNDGRLYFPSDGDLFAQCKNGTGLRWLRFGQPVVPPGACSGFTQFNYSGASCVDGVGVVSLLVPANAAEGNPRGLLYGAVPGGTSYNLTIGVVHSSLEAQASQACGMLVTSGTSNGSGAFVFGQGAAKTYAVYKYDAATDTALGGSGSHYFEPSTTPPEAFLAAPLGTIRWFQLNRNSTTLTFRYSVSGKAGPWVDFTTAATGTWFAPTHWGVGCVGRSSNKAMRVDLVSVDAQ